MSEKVPQNYKNHVRFDPPYHFFILPVFVIAVFVSIWNLIQNFGLAALWGLIVAVALAFAVLKIRLNALKVQDRVIRLEERLRLSTLLPGPLRARIGELTESQLVALRFASDAEVPGLVEKTLAGNLKNADIKKMIVTWRADYFRV
jgi:uncharacterized protein DUF6526